MDAIQFNVTNAAVAGVLNLMKQYFISIEFLDFPPEELESPSLGMVMSEEAIVNIGFERGKLHLFISTIFKTALTTVSWTVFDFDPYLHVDRRRALHSKLASEDLTQSSLIFSVVSEPTEPNGDCEDFAVAEMNLQDLINSRSDWSRKELNLWDIKGDLLVGKLWVSLVGWELLQELKLGHV